MLLDGWSHVPLGSRISIKHGYAFASAEFNADGDGYRLLTPAHFREDGGFRDLGDKQKYFSGTFPPEYLLHRGDLLVAMTEQAPGLLGSPLTVPEDLAFLHNQRLGLVVVDELGTTSPAFLFHLFNSAHVRKCISDTSAGTKVRHTSPDRIRAVEVAFPPLLEQRRIAAVLDTWDRGIRQLTDLIAAKVRFKQGLMQQLLTGKRRFKGFRGEWVLVRAGDLFARQMSRGNGNAPVLSVTQDYGVVRRDLLDRKISAEEASYGTYKRVEPADFVISLRSFQGGLELCREAGVVSPAYHVIRAARPVVTDFYKHYFKSPRFITHLASTLIGIRDGKQISFGDFERIQVPYPHTVEQRRVASLLDALDREIDLLRKQLEALKQQKRGMMQKLLTGEVRVPLTKGRA